ncbi:Peroxiredoxin [Saitozyma sp. JCM 24511]|nr:Peroxiredoxin [Saitozyma sp. JCM 24511]
MPPKSSTAAPTSAARRSTRLTATATASSDKKRAAEDKPASLPSPKKTKTVSKSAPPPKSAEPKSKTKTQSKAKAKPAVPAAVAEEVAEAPKDAEPETDGEETLQLGDKLPKISLRDNEGTEVDVAGLAGAKGVVIFLYPKADTPGCTTQACGFRDAFDDIAALGYDVYGLSRDEPKAQQRWKEKKGLNYRLLCDPESKLIKRLGAFVPPKNTKRSHFIFEKGSGKLVEAKLGVKPADE